MGQISNFVNFYNNVWNVDTANDFGLNIWGRIVDVSRLLHLPNQEISFGFKNGAIPPDTAPFGQGTFSTGNSSTQTYILPADAYRTLVLTKALANIASTDAPTLNKLLQNLFPGRGRCYVLDLGLMTMRFVFEFDLTIVEQAILAQSGVLPHTTAVAVQIMNASVPAVAGFEEAGYGAPFGEAVFYNPTTGQI